VIIPQPVMDSRLLKSFEKVELMSESQDIRIKEEMLNKTCKEEMYFR
jgi:hypothetical protein